MTEELLKKLHTAMCNDNEHQCNRLNNYIHTDEYLTAEVVKVVREIVAEATKELKEELEQWKEEWQEQVQKATDEGFARTQLQIENGKLKEQIEKMKCCGNCKHRYFIGDELECRLLDKGINCADEEKWELAE